jgi:hypothetical protein
MNRPFPRIEVLGLTAALALAGACTPSNSVKPGAPVLVSLSIVESGGATITTVTPTTGFCTGAPQEGGPCDPVADAVCESVTTHNLCRCVPPPPPTSPPPATDAGASDAARPDGSSAVSDAAAVSDASASDAAATKDSGADAASTLTGTWTCSFAPTAVVLYTFDRVLDTNTFMANDAGSLLNAALPPVFVPAPPSSVSLTGDYAPNGSPDLFIFHYYGYRGNGPSLLFAGAPALPTSSAVTITLDKNNVLAKDGRTAFTGMNLLLDGAISFVTQPLSVAVTTPPPPPKAADAGADAAAPTDVVPDMTAATATFNNIVCPQLPNGKFDAMKIKEHITASSVPTGSPTTTLPTPVDVDVAAMDGLNVAVTPHTTWPASSDITIFVDATAADILGDQLGSVITGKFSTMSAM